MLVTGAIFPVGGAFFLLYEGFVLLCEAFSIPAAEGFGFVLLGG